MFTAAPSSYGYAQDLLKAGKCVRRACWNPGTFLTLVPGSTITVSEGRPLAAVLPVGTQVTYHHHIDMVTRNAAGEVEMFPWHPSLDSLMAMDWVEHTL